MQVVKRASNCKRKKQEKESRLKMRSFIETSVYDPEYNSMSGPLCTRLQHLWLNKLEALCCTHCSFFLPFCARFVLL